MFDNIDPGDEDETIARMIRKAEAPIIRNFDKADKSNVNLHCAFRGLSLTEERLHSLSNKQLDQLIENPQLSTLDKKTTVTNPDLRWVNSFNINKRGFSIPGDDIHRELQSLERQFRESLYRILKPETPENYRIEAGDYALTLSNEINNKKAISAALEGNPNFVVAQFGFVVKKADGEMIYMHYPIKTRNSQQESQDIYSCRSFTDKKYIRRFSSHTRDTMMLQHLRRRYAVGTKITKGASKPLDLNAQTLDSDFSHSEQALYLYLDTNDAKDDLVSKLQKDLQNEGITTFTIDQVILDLHSTRYMCGHCQTSTFGEQNSVLSDMFLGLLSRKLNAVFKRKIVDLDGSQMAKLGMTTRVGASVKHGNMKSKTPPQHQKNSQPSNDVILAADMVTLQGNSRLSEIGDLSEYTVFTSGGNTLTQQQIFQLAYDKTTRKDQHAREEHAGKVIVHAAKNFLMRRRLPILASLAREKRLRKWIEYNETVEELFDASEYDLFGLTDDQYDALTPKVVELLENYHIGFSCFLKWAEEDSDALQLFANNNLNPLEDIFGKDDITEDNITSCLDLGSDGFTTLLNELEDCEEYVFEDIDLRTFLSAYAKTREVSLWYDSDDECYVDSPNLALQTANRLNRSDVSDYNGYDEYAEESDQYEESYAPQILCPSDNSGYNSNDDDLNICISRLSL